MIIEFLKAVLFGIVEGITEWLPVSSTGHIILLDEFIKLKISPAFYDLFEIVIQLGAILAVIVLFFHKLNPFSGKKSVQQKKDTWQLWFKVVAAVIPSAIIGLLLDDPIDSFLRSTSVMGTSLNAIVVAAALILYGIAFILVEKRNGETGFKITDVGQITYKTALLIGAFQCLSIIPGTSRSGATILGAILLGVSRPAGAEFSFFLAIPTMLGASALKLVDYLLEGVQATGTELGVLLIGLLAVFGGVSGWLMQDWVRGLHLRDRFARRLGLILLLVWLLLGFAAGVPGVALFAAGAWVLTEILRIQSASGSGGFDALRLSQMAVRLPLAVTLLAMMLSAAFWPRLLQKLLDNRLMRFLSTISMNLYIWHQTLAVQMRLAWFPDTNLLHTDPNLQKAYTLLSYSVAILMAMIMTYGVEQPAAKRLGRLLSSRKSKY